MLAKPINVYAISGWGFQPSLFNAVTYPAFNIIGVDYMPFAHLPPERMVEHLAHALPNDAYLLGWSLGGLLAIQLASLFPRKVNKLILVASQPKFTSAVDWVGIDVQDSEHVKRAFAQDFDKQMQYFIRLVCYPSRSSQLRSVLQTNLCRTQHAALISLLDLLFSLDLRTEYQHLTMDILHMVSERDAIIPQTASQLTALNSRVKTIMLEQASHAGFLTHASCLNAIDLFLSHE